MTLPLPPDDGYPTAASNGGIYHTPLAEIGLPVRVNESLEKHGMHTLGDLLETSSEELKKIVSLSPHVMAAIEGLRTSLASQRLEVKTPLSDL
jgi:DNA-directed RNA polymerase alpha subunit